MTTAIISLEERVELLSFDAEIGLIEIVNESEECARNESKEGEELIESKSERLGELWNLWLKLIMVVKLSETDWERLDENGMLEVDRDVPERIREVGGDEMIKVDVLRVIKKSQSRLWIGVPKNKTLKSREGNEVNDVENSRWLKAEQFWKGEPLKLRLVKSPKNKRLETNVSE